MARRGFFGRIWDAAKYVITGEAPEESVPDYVEERPPTRTERRRPSPPRGLPPRNPGEDPFDYRDRLRDLAGEQVARWGRGGWLSPPHAKQKWHQGRAVHNIEQADYLDLDDFFEMSVEDYRAAAARKPAIFGYH